MRIALFVLFIAVSGLSACSKNPVSTNPSNNPGIKVKTLFDHEGCRVYRFLDHNSFIYYAKCGQSSNTSWNETYLAGKVVVVEPKGVITTR